ncbi:MAG: TetR/AcrR family transcriptional regulator [Acidimicrobiales bacterium]
MEETSSREPLSRPSIVGVAIAIADDEGVGVLTMRYLADRLGFKAMALYNHVSNKEELLGLMVDAVADEINDPPADQPPLDAVRAMAISTRAALVRHPWAPDLWQRHMPGPARTRHMENLLRTFDQSGLSPELAHHGFHAVNNHVLGYTLQEITMSLALEGSDDPWEKAYEFLDLFDADVYPYTVAHVHQHIEGHTGASFELVLDFILDGLQRLNNDGSARNL